MEESSYPSQRDRALWTAVVLMALTDIRLEPLESLEYNEAVAFLTHSGDWATSRADIALHLDFHPDDLARAGRNAIAKRREEDGLPPEVFATKVATPQHTPLPRLEAIPPVLTAAEQHKQQRPARRDRNWWIAKFLNGSPDTGTPATGTGVRYRG